MENLYRLKSLYLFLCVSIIAINGLIHDLPSYVTKCHLNDPKINECLLRATEQIKPYLVKGIPELGVPPIDPLHIPQVELKQGTQALNFKATLKNLIVKGLRNYNFTKFEFDVPNLQWFTIGSVPELSIDGDYAVSGKVLIAPIEGNGKFHANIGHSSMDVYQKTKVVTKKGEEYLSPLITNGTVHVASPKIKLDGLFNDNPDLNKITTKIINENINELFEELRPVVEHIISKLLEDSILGSLENNIPFKKLYPVD